jgi:hypothetical protein
VHDKRAAHERSERLDRKLFEHGYLIASALPGEPTPPVRLRGLLVKKHAY